MTKKKNKHKLFKRIVLSLCACFIAVFSVFNLFNFKSDTIKVNASEVVNVSGDFVIKNPYFSYSLDFIDDTYFDYSSIYNYVIILPSFTITQGSLFNTITLRFQYFNNFNIFNCRNSFNAFGAIDVFPYYSSLENSGASLKVYDGNSLLLNELVNSNNVGSSIFYDIYFNSSGSSISIQVPNNGYSFEFSCWLTTNVINDPSSFNMLIPFNFYYSGSSSSFDYNTYHRFSQEVAFVSSNYGNLFNGYSSFVSLSSIFDVFTFNNSYLAFYLPVSNYDFSSANYFLQDPSSAYQSGYDNGYQLGEDAGYDAGYDIGYDEGEDAGYVAGYNEGVRVNADSSYAQGYDDGISTGYENGLNEGTILGYQDGYYRGEIDGKNIGYQQGLEASNRYNFTNLISAVIDVPVNTFTSLFNFEILGVNMSGFFLGLLTLCVIVTIVKLIL